VGAELPLFSSEGVMSASSTQLVVEVNSTGGGESNLRLPNLTGVQSLLPKHPILKR
jgi:hypothetical protein